MTSVQANFYIALVERVIKEHKNEMVKARPDILDRIHESEENLRDWCDSIFPHNETITNIMLDIQLLIGF